MFLKNILLVIFSFISLTLPGKEGMWLPWLLTNSTIKDMQDLGFQLTREDIYDINHSSLKDAVVKFGGGCTGEVISKDGLLLTNHHCGFSIVQSLSTLGENYTEKGYWAMNREEEMPCPGLTVTFLRKVEDVSKQVLENIAGTLTEEERKMMIEENIERLKENVEGDYKIVVTPFFKGNIYYMFLYEEFKDIRLVGAPPKSVGNFGGDTDNWMWPRHAADFMVFRIYANQDNQPAAYDSLNQPYSTENYLKISLKGLQKDDFTMILGFPGSTDEYVYSTAVKNQLETLLPGRIAMRGARLEKMKYHMEKDEEVYFNYINKHKSASNAYKKWKGMVMGLDRIEAVDKKKEFEKNITREMQINKGWGYFQQGLLDSLDTSYEKVLSYEMVYYFMYEIFSSVELFNFTREFVNLINLVTRSGDDYDQVVKQLEKIKNKSKYIFSQCHLPMDHQVLAAQLAEYDKHIDPVYHPSFFEEVHKNFNGDFYKYTEKIYSTSIFTNEDKLNKILDNFKVPGLNKIIKDPLFRVYDDFINTYSTLIIEPYKDLSARIDSLDRKYMEIIRLSSQKRLYPDANFSLRLTYGKVEGYSPWDAIFLEPFTTLEGVIEKRDSSNEEFQVPGRLQELFEKKDYGVYRDQQGKMPVCFIASNHTSGGNSGSPVLNAKGELVGINFDRNWEGTMSDLYYDVSLCRNIAVDIRYVLFIIDKFAGAKHIVEEMDIVN